MLDVAIVYRNGCDFPLNVGDENPFFEKESFQMISFTWTIPPTSMRVWHFVLKVAIFYRFFVLWNQDSLWKDTQQGIR